MATKRKQDWREQQCMTPGCERTVEIKKAKLCGRCYAWVKYWDNRLLEDKLERLHTLQYWARRASFYFTPSTGSQGTETKRRKK